MPIHFVFSDGRSSWENAVGQQINTESFYNVLSKEKGAALYSALSTEFAEHLLALALNHYLKYQRAVPSTEFLVATANITETRRHHMCLLDNGYSMDLATGPDTDEAVAQIEDLMGGMKNIVVGE